MNGHQLLTVSADSTRTKQGLSADALAVLACYAEHYAETALDGLEIAPGAPARVLLRRRYLTRAAWQRGYSELVREGLIASLELPNGHLVHVCFPGTLKRWCSPANVRELVRQLVRSGWGPLAGRPHAVTRSILWGFGDSGLDRARSEEIVLWSGYSAGTVHTALTAMAAAGLLHLTDGFVSLDIPALRRLAEGTYEWATN